jgi:hypothetical protein
MQQLINSKSLLAKLMATENLVVEQRNVRTASFDAASRVLTVPVLDENISGYLYDLFMGHEVGHALYTPVDGLKKAWELKLPQGITNVLEDVRIERKIKNKYPGIRSSFVRGYNELVEKDFFGTAGTDLNDLNFIDRVNLYTKGGAAQGIKFKDGIEKILLKKIESTETYDDVITLAQEVMSYLKEEEEERKANRPQFEEDEDGEYEDFDSEGYEDSDDFDNWDDELEPKKAGDNSDDSENTDDELNDEKDGNHEGGGSSPEGQNDQPIKSHTDEAFRRNESKLFSDSNKSLYYGNIPDFDLEKVIVPHKQLWKRYRDDVTERTLNWSSEFKGVNLKKFMKLRNDSKKVVGYLAKEFELRKNAEQMKRASVAKTGELNMSKIYAYQLTDDIFKKMTVIPGAKSHGLVMFLDWSGSMHNHLDNTMKQLINLVMFCKKVNIPYEVYAFSSEYDDCYNHPPKEGDIYTQQFKLLNLFSSKMSAAEFSYAGAALCQMTEYRRGYKPHWFSLGGTPLTEAILSAMKIVPQFQKDYKLQIVNTVFLTDGEGHSLNQVVYKDSNGRMTSGTCNRDEPYDYSRTSRVMVIRDPITKMQEKVENNYGRPLTAAYIKMLKARTDSNIVGFYVLAGRELSRELYHFMPNVPSYVHDKHKVEFRKNKFMVVTSAGYDEYYLLRAEGLDTDDDVEFTVKENATTRGLVSAFNKYAGNRLSNRVVLNRFVGLIA